MVKIKKDKVIFKTPKKDKDQSRVFSIIMIFSIVIIGIEFDELFQSPYIIYAVIAFIISFIALKIKYRDAKCNIITVSKNDISFSYRENIPWSSIKKIELNTCVNDEIEPDTISLYYIDSITSKNFIETIKLEDIVSRQDHSIFKRVLFRNFNNSIKRGNSIDATLYKTEEIYKTFKSNGVTFILMAPIYTIYLVIAFTVMYKYSIDPSYTRAVVYGIPFLFIYLWGYIYKNSYYVALQEGGIDIAGKLFIPWEQVKHVKYKYSKHYKDVIPIDVITLYYFDPIKNKEIRIKLKSMFFDIENPEELEILINHHIKKNKC